MDLEEGFEQDFNAKLEDSSPYEVRTEHVAGTSWVGGHADGSMHMRLQVAKVLVLLHNELLQGSTATLERLRRTAPGSTSSSRQQKALSLLS